MKVQSPIEESTSLATEPTSVREVVRGFSALFWGLPLAVVLSFKTVNRLLLSPIEALLPIGAFALLFYGVSMMKRLRLPHSRPRRTLDWVGVLALINLGLSPFIYFWSRQPYEPYFSYVLWALMAGGLLFLYAYNELLSGLAALVPDGTLQSEVRLFSSLNNYCLTIFAGAFIGSMMVSSPSIADLMTAPLPHPLIGLIRTILLVLLLLPLALTMTMTWKIKEWLWEQSLPRS